MIHSYVKISLGITAESIQCSSCLRTLGLARKKQKQEVFCLDCVNHQPKDDANSTNSAPKDSEVASLVGRELAEVLNRFEGRVLDASARGMLATKLFPLFMKCYDQKFQKEHLNEQVKKDGS